MTSHVLSAAFRPATTLVARLRYAQKFVVVGLVLLIPLGFVASAYVQLQHSQIVFSAKERDGVAVMTPLIALTARTVQARHHAVDGTTPRPLDRELAAVDAVNQRLGDGLGVVGDWRTTRALVVAAQHRTGTRAAQFAAYDSAADALLAMIVRVGDASNLTLDPDLDSYYLMDTLQFRLPVLLNTAGHAIDRARVAGLDLTDAYIDLGLDNGVLTSNHEAVIRAVNTVATKTANRTVRDRTEAGLKRLDRATTALDAVLTAAVKGRDVSTVSARDANDVEAAAAAFAVGVADSLDALLATRIDGLAARATQVQFATGVAVLLAGYLFIGFYLSVVPPVRRIVDTLRGVAGGDLSRRVRVDTHDELSVVAHALNDTIAQTEVARDRLAERATHDPLTALPNRALVVERLTQGLARTGRNGQLMAALFIDLDRFKPINDSLGHESGDVVLCAIAERLKLLVRGGDTVGRLAGDEFVVITEDLAGAQDAVSVAERVVDALSAPITLATGREVSVGASVGIAFAGGIFDGPHPDRALGPEDILRHADVAMYRAKQRGRGRVEIFDETLRVAVEKRQQVQDELRHGLDDGQLRVHYRPIVHGRTGDVLAYEALARWEHPVRGLVGADEFIGIAEETGLIVPLGAAVLHEACATIARRRAEVPGAANLHVGVNVSAAQLNHPSFVATVASALARSGLDPAALWLEITESTIMRDHEVAEATVRAIGALGVHLSIDDFGTGYSSLSHLRRLPVQALKIHHSFVDGLGHELEDEAIVAMIVGLARTLGLHVVADGVQTAEQVAHLDRLGCVYLQGPWFAPPAPLSSPAADPVGADLGFTSVA